MDNFLRCMQSSTQLKMLILMPTAVMADAATPEVVSKKRKMYKRLYDDKYVAAYGFIVINVAGEQRPQCVICSIVLSNDDMKSAKLYRNFTSKHAEFK